MELTLKTCAVRSWRTSDAESLLRHANNRNIWLNLRDAFPHPYTKHDARAYIRSVRDRSPETTFAIAVDDEAVGSIGFVLRSDVERVSAEIGYWLAEPFWGRGIATEAGLRTRMTASGGRYRRIESHRKGKDGEPRRIRTFNQRIKSPLLYR